MLVPPRPVKHGRPGIGATPLLPIVCTSGIIYNNRNLHITYSIPLK